MAECAFPECPYPTKARGWCIKHYHRIRQFGTPEGKPVPTISERFWKSVDTTGDCWLWKGRDVTTNGYGRFTFRHGKYDQRRAMAHRWAWEEAYGPIPEGLTLDHLCRTPLCVRPTHMEPISMRENILRSDNPMAVNARKTECPQGHPYDETNTRRGGKGERLCRQCHNQKALAAYHSKRAAAGKPREVYPGERTHCPQGHEYTPDNTYSSSGKRHCRICQKARSREYYLRSKQRS